MSRKENLYFSFLFVCFPLSKCRTKNIHDFGKSLNVESIISYCILSLLDSGSLRHFSLPDLMVSTLLHRYFSQATAGNQRGEPKKGHIHS